MVGDMDEMRFKRTSTSERAMRSVAAELGRPRREGPIDRSCDRVEDPLSRSLVRGLEARGLDSSLSETLCEQLHGQAVGMSADEREALLDGAALAFDVRNRDDNEFVPSATQVREIERMMQAFSGELSKLDESLELLAAYVRRMKTPVRDTPNSETVLH